MLQSLANQNLIVAAIVLTAAILLAIRASKYFRAAQVKAGCGSGCSNCANNQPATPANQPIAAAPPLLQLGSRDRQN